MPTVQEGNGVDRLELQQGAGRSPDQVDIQGPSGSEAIGQELWDCVREFEQAFEASLRRFERRFTIHFAAMLFVAWGLVVVVLKVCP